MRRRDPRPAPAPPPEPGSTALLSPDSRLIKRQIILGGPDLKACPLKGGEAQRDHSQIETLRNSKWKEHPWSDILRTPILLLFSELGARGESGCVFRSHLTALSSGPMHLCSGAWVSQCACCFPWAARLSCTCWRRVGRWESPALLLAREFDFRPLPQP